MQLALGGGAIIYSPILIVLLPKTAAAVRREQWWEVVVGILVPLALIGIAALIASIVLPAALVARRKKIRVVLFAGLSAGLLVSASLLIRYISKSPRLPRDWFSLYLIAGPAIVALWNIYRFTKAPNQAAQTTPGSSAPLRV